MPPIRWYQPKKRNNKQWCALLFHLEEVNLQLRALKSPNYDLRSRGPNYVIRKSSSVFINEDDYAYFVLCDLQASCKRFLLSRQCFLNDPLSQAVALVGRSSGAEHIMRSWTKDTKHERVNARKKWHRSADPRVRDLNLIYWSARHRDEDFHWEV